jgi:hypothetical protein
MFPKNTIERAFELARGGECRSINDIRQQLKIEGCANYDAHLSGLSIKRQLVALMKQ